MARIGSQPISAKEVKRLPPYAQLKAYAAELITISKTSLQQDTLLYLLKMLKAKYLFLAT